MMKYIKIKLLVISLLITACQTKQIKTKYTIRIPDKSKTFHRTYHTNQIDIDGKSITFIPIEDSLHKYTCENNWSIENN